MRLYAAPAQAFSIITPFAFMIWDDRGKVRYNLNRYCKMVTRRRTCLEAIICDPFRFGITAHTSTYANISKC